MQKQDGMQPAVSEQAMHAAGDNTPALLSNDCVVLALMAMRCRPSVAALV